MTAPEASTPDSTTDKLPPARRWIRLSLRTFVVILLLSGAVGGWLGVSGYDKRRTAQRCFDEFVSTSRDTHTYRDVEYERLLACGESFVVPVVADALEGGDIFPRYDPPPVVILEQFPQAAQSELRRRLSEGLKLNSDRRFSELKNRGIALERRSCLIYGLMSIAHDWSYLDQWLADAQLPERDGWQGGQSGIGINSLVSNELEKLGAPRLLLFNDTFNGKLNPDFVSWWIENRTLVVKDGRQ